MNVYTSAKGKGRRGNPKNPDGSTMTCWDCGSTDHLRSECPNKGKGAQVHYAGGKGGQRKKFRHNHGKLGKQSNPPTFLSLNDPNLVGGQGVDGHMHDRSQTSGIHHEQFMYVDQTAQQNEQRQAYMNSAAQQSYRGPLSGILADNDEDEYPEDRHQMAPPHYIVVQSESGNHNNLHGLSYAQREYRWSPENLTRQDISDRSHVHPIYAGVENHHNNLNELSLIHI